MIGMHVGEVIKDGDHAVAYATVGTRIYAFRFPADEWEAATPAERTMMVGKAWVAQDIEEQKTPQ